MLRKVRAHVRQQSVGYLALFIALGGTTYAAATIGPADIKSDAVRSRHINNGAVKNADLGANSVGTGKVINNSLTGDDLATLTGADIEENTLEGVDAAALGGLPAADFQGHCVRGAALAAFTVYSSAFFPSSYTSAATDIKSLSPNFCKTDMSAKRTSQGHYSVCFPRGGSSPVAAVASVLQGGGDAYAHASFRSANECGGAANDPILDVSIWDPSPGGYDDWDFTVVVF